MSLKHWWSGTHRGEPKYRRQNCPSATSSATNRTIWKILIWETEVLGDKTIPVPLCPPQIALLERYWYEKSKYCETKLSQYHIVLHKSHFWKDTDMRNQSTGRQNSLSATSSATNRTIWKILIWETEVLGDKMLFPVRTYSPILSLRQRCIVLRHQLQATAALPPE